MLLDNYLSRSKERKDDHKYESSPTREKHIIKLKHRDPGAVEAYVTPGKQLNKERSTTKATLPTSDYGSEPLRQRSPLKVSNFLSAGHESTGKRANGTADKLKTMID